MEWNDFAYFPVAPCLLFLSPSKIYHFNRKPETAEVYASITASGFSHFYVGKERIPMLKTLLSVIRAVIVELVNQLFRQVCTTVG